MKELKYVTCNNLFQSPLNKHFGGDTKPFLCWGFWADTYIGNGDKISMGSGWLALLSAEHLAPSKVCSAGPLLQMQWEFDYGLLSADVGQWSCITSVFFEANSSGYPTLLHLNNGVASERVFDSFLDKTKLEALFQEHIWH